MQIDARDSATLKGIAILAIVLHNYFHLISAVKEDEFSFDPARFHSLLGTIREPTEAIQALFSYFGHYGVQIFIFISAYGLALKYWDTRHSRMAFVRQRMKKLYPMFLSAIYWWPLFLILLAGPSGAVEILRVRFGSLLLTLAGIENLLPLSALANHGATARPKGRSIGSRRRNGLCMAAPVSSSYVHGCFRSVHVAITQFEPNSRKVRKTPARWPPTISLTKCVR